MTNTMIIAQILGAFGFAFFVLSIQMKKRNLLLMQLFSNLFYTISYLVLRAIPAVIIDVISFIRCLIYYYFNKKNSKCPIYIMLLLVIISIMVGFFIVKDIYDVIPIIVCIIYIISTWQENNYIIYYSVVFAAILWIIYNFHVGAYMPIIGNIFEICSGVIAIIRYRKKLVNKN